MAGINFIQIDHTNVIYSVGQCMCRMIQWLGDACLLSQLESVHMDT